MNSLRFNTLMRPTLFVLTLWSVAACGAGAETDTAASAADTTTATPASITLVAADLAEATTGEITAGILLTGMLEPGTTVAVTAQAAGTMQSITVDRGSSVARGTTLASINADGIRSGAAGARAALAAADANLIAARIRRDAADRLFAAGATSRADAEGAKAAYAAAEAQVAAAKSQLAMAEEQLGFTTVTAPIAGVVSARAVESGQAVRVGDPLFTVVSTSTLELAGRVPVDAAGGIKVGQQVRFTIDALAGEVFTGTVNRKDPVADPSSRQVGVWVRLPNQNGRITAGQYASGEVAGATLRDAVRVPETAVVGEGEGAHVFVVAGEQLVRRPVVVGVRDARAGLVAITQGLSVGERVLIRPASGLLDTQKVVITGER